MANNAFDNIRERIDRARSCDERIRDERLLYRCGATLDGEEAGHVAG